MAALQKFFNGNENDEQNDGSAQKRDRSKTGQGHRVVSQPIAA
jgi:hypothetical protein